MASVSFYVKSDGEFLNSRMWIPEKSREEAVVFCHGWGGGAPYDDLLALLAERGYFALRFEQRGYGESTGGADLSLWSSPGAEADEQFDGFPFIEISDGSLLGSQSRHPTEHGDETYSTQETYRHRA